MKHHRKTLKVVAIIIPVLAILGLGSFFTWRWYEGKHPIPATITREVTFPIFYPNAANITVTKSTIEYSSSAQALSFVGFENGNTKLIFSEEPTPSQFTDIPGYYPALLNNMNEYSDINTINGEVYLTKPESVDGNEAGVLNAKGTLMFIRAEANLTTNQWRQIFNNVSIIVR